MKSHFFAMVSRMKYINRWALMRNTRNENICEHSMEVSAIAHHLALISNKITGQQLNCERAAVLALYHDMPEILTGDLPTPIKYYNPKIKEVYSEVEDTACRKLLDMLPKDFQEDYRPLFFHEREDDYLWKLVKAADKISALIKCIEERKAGNMEFASAEVSTRQIIENLHLPEVDYFMDTYISSYSLNIDEQK